MFDGAFKESHSSGDCSGFTPDSLLIPAVCSDGHETESVAKVAVSFEKKDTEHLYFILEYKKTPSQPYSGGREFCG